MKKQFIHLSAAWYGPVNLESKCYRGGLQEIIDEVSFSRYAEDGGTEGEMVVKWLPLGREAVPQLCVFSDAWKVLASFGMPFFNALAAVDSQNITPEEFCALLRRLGFKDNTPRENPYK